MRLIALIGLGGAAGSMLRANVVTNVVLGLTAVWLGRVAAHALWG